MSDFAVTSQYIPRQCAVVKLEGGQSDDDFDRLAKELFTLLDAGILGIILDISGLTSLTSAGLGAIIDLQKNLGYRDGKLLLANPTTEMLATLELMSVKQLFTIVPTVNEGKKAIAHL